MLDLPRPIDPLMGVIQESALLSRLGNGLQAEPSHGDEKQRDQKEPGYQFSVHRRLDAGNPINQFAEWRAAEKKVGNPYAPVCRCRSYNHRFAPAIDLSLSRYFKLAERRLLAKDDEIRQPNGSIDHLLPKIA